MLLAGAGVADLFFASGLIWQSMQPYERSYGRGGTEGQDRPIVEDLVSAFFVKEHADSRGSLRE